MRDQTIMQLIQANMNKVYLVLHREQVAYLSFVIQTKATIDVVLYEIIPYRWRMIKIIFWLIFSPFKAQQYINDLVNKHLELMKKINKKKEVPNETPKNETGN